MYQCWEKGGTINTGRPVMNRNVCLIHDHQTDYLYASIRMKYMSLYLSLDLSQPR